jgi:hypothetical protein
VEDILAIILNTKCRGEYYWIPERIIDRKMEKENLNNKEFCCL